MNDEILVQLKYQNETLDKIAQLLQDTMDQQKQQHIASMKLGDSIEAFLSMIQGNTEG